MRAGFDGCKMLVILPLLDFGEVLCGEDGEENHLPIDESCQLDAMRMGIS